MRYGMLTLRTEVARVPEMTKVRGGYPSRLGGSAFKFDSGCLKQHASTGWWDINNKALKRR